MSVTKQLMDPIDFIVFKSMGSINCLVTHILQMCSAELKKTHTGLEQHEADRTVIFG